MESTGEAMKIHITKETLSQTNKNFISIKEVEVEVKGKGKIETYFL